MSKKLECEIVQDLLPMYVDQLTSDYTTQRVKEHLEECSPCHEIYDLMTEGVEEQVQHNAVEVKKLKWYMKKFKVFYLLIGAILAFGIFIGGNFIYGQLFISANSTVDNKSVEVTELYQLEGGYIYANIRVTDGYFVDYVSPRFNDESQIGEATVTFGRTIIPKVSEERCGGDDINNACGVSIAFNPETSQFIYISFGAPTDTDIPDDMSIVNYIEKGLSWENPKGNALNAFYYEGKNKEDRVLIWERGMDLPLLDE